jgi:type IV secretory pathway VirB6-like protein
MSYCSKISLEMHTLPSIYFSSVIIRFIIDNLSGFIPYAICKISIIETLYSVQTLNPYSFSDSFKHQKFDFK